MGNHHHTGRQLWANQWSHHCILRGALRGFHYSLQDSSDTESEPEENTCSGNATSERLQEAVLNNDVQVLKDLINNNEVDLNMPMNSKEETALMMSVKLSHLDMVQTLLTFPNCNNNAFNSHHFSVLDAALIALFDRKDSPQSELCWQILVTLIKAKSEPLSKDAMIYVIRTALKNQDTDFISRLIDTVTAESDSPVLHQFLLEKLHRHQPIYPESMDPILEQMTHFTVSLLRGSSILTLRQVVPDMEFYLESYWRSREKKERVVTQLVVYATAAGSNWTEHEIVAIGRVIPSLARWCCRCKHVPMSLSHSSRLAFRSSVSHSVTQSISALPQHVPKLLKNYLLLHDLDSLPHNIFDLYL